MAQKLFGSTSKAKFRHSRKAKQKSRLKPLKIILCILLILEILYCVAIFSNIPLIAKLRHAYIETAVSTMNHQWLAYAFIPKDIVDEVVAQRDAARQAQTGLVSTWTKPTEAQTEPVQAATEETAPTDETQRVLTPEQETFFELFWELDQESMFAYVEKHPEAVAGGWSQININEAGLDDNGTSIQTTMGEQVLAINVPDQVLLVRVKGSTYRGVLAIAKDPSRLLLAPSKGIGGYGQVVGDIARANSGLLAITASGFDDPNGTGNGGILAGACMCSGKSYGNHFTGYGYKRLELREDNRMYITDAYTWFHEDTTDAMEFMPALIVDGEIALPPDTIFTDMNPRACLGQSSKEEVLMLVIEGRLTTSLGTDARECTEILALHDCYQAMNLDGGTSAIMWYDGEYITRCSNTALDEGRYVPNAWVYTTMAD